MVFRSGRGSLWLRVLLGQLSRRQSLGPEVGSCSGKMMCCGVMARLPNPLGPRLFMSQQLEISASEGVHPTTCIIASLPSGPGHPSRALWMMNAVIVGTHRCTLTLPKPGGDTQDTSSFDPLSIRRAVLATAIEPRRFRRGRREMLRRLDESEAGRGREPDEKRETRVWETMRALGGQDSHADALSRKVLLGSPLCRGSLVRTTVRLDEVASSVGPVGWEGSAFARRSLSSKKDDDD